jgi:hypothetical protein
LLVMLVFCWLACAVMLLFAGVCLLAYHACVCLLVMVAFSRFAFGLSCLCWLAILCSLGMLVFASMLC